MVFLVLSKGSLAFLSNCDRDLRERLMFPHGVRPPLCQREPQFLSSRCRGIGPHQGGGRELVFSAVIWIRGSYQVSNGSQASLQC